MKAAIPMTESEKRATAPLHLRLLEDARDVPVGALEPPLGGAVPTCGVKTLGSKPSVGDASSPSSVKLAGCFPLGRNFCL